MTLVTWLAASALLVAGAAPGETASAVNKDASQRELTLEDVLPKELETFYVVFLRRPVDAPEVAEEESKRIQIAHLAHLNRLRDEGLTLIHGPFRDSPDPALRGMLVFRGDLPRERIEAEMAADPWVQRGRLVIDVVRWMTPAHTFRQPGGAQAAPPANGR